MSNSAVSYKDLLAQRATLEAQIEAARKSEIGTAVQQIKGLIATYGLTQDDIFPKRKQKQLAALLTPSIVTLRLVKLGQAVASLLSGSKIRIARNSKSNDCSRFDIRWPLSGHFMST
jgi:hypothetical protein